MWLTFKKLGPMRICLLNSHHCNCTLQVSLYHGNILQQTNLPVYRLFFSFVLIYRKHVQARFDLMINAYTKLHLFMMSNNKIEHKWIQIVIFDAKNYTVQCRCFNHCRYWSYWKTNITCIRKQLSVSVWGLCHVGTPVQGTSIMRHINACDVDFTFI